MNIKPEQAGHTLISVYQMPPDGSGEKSIQLITVISFCLSGYPPPHTQPPVAAVPSAEEHPKSSDSVPPEPIPSYQNAVS